MKTFRDLIDEVQKKGLCHQCSGCVTFCTAINYSALELDSYGMPQFGEEEKCIECGLCYSICPEVHELEDEIKKKFSWQPPIGKNIETTAARSLHIDIRKKATDGGAVTSILLHLFDTGKIDGAIVTKQTGPFSRQPLLATTREEIIDSAGFYFDTSHGMKHFSSDYSTYSPSVQEFKPVIEKGLSRIAMVGTPCQIEAVRKIETLGIVPSDSIKYVLGLFCSGNFIFNEEAQTKLEKLGSCKLNDLKKINVKDDFLLHLNSGEIRKIGLDKLDFMKRKACRFCMDYSAELADISFGGIGANEGWTTVITRTPLGRAMLADAKGKTLEISSGKDGLEDSSSKSVEKIIEKSMEKQKLAKENRKKIE